MTNLRSFQLYGEFTDRRAGRDFWFQCDSVADLYERHFHADIRTKTASKIAVRVKKLRTPDHLRELDITIDVEVLDDCGGFFSWPDRKKQESALRWLHVGCVEAASHFGWPLAPFEAARQAVIDANFVNKWVLRHMASRKDRRFRAELHCDHGIYEFRSELVIFKKNTEVARFPDLVTQPDRMIFGWDLGKLRWVSDTEVELRNIRGNEPRLIDVSLAVSKAED